MIGVLIQNENKELYLTSLLDCGVKIRVLETFTEPLPCKVEALGEFNFSNSILKALSIKKQVKADDLFALNIKLIDLLQKID